MEGEVGETVVSYIFVRYFCSLYKRVGCDYSSLLSMPLQPPRGVPVATCQRSQAAARCSCLGYRWRGGQIAFQIPIRSVSTISPNNRGLREKRVPGSGDLPYLPELHDIRRAVPEMYKQLLRAFLMAKLCIYCLPSAATLSAIRTH